MIKVALVDDHVLLRKGMANIIEGFDGFTVLLEADNGKHFIEQLDPLNLPNIILLDITMPQMNGFETADWINKHYPQIKMMIISLHNNDKTVVKMLKHGAKGYITKDTDPIELERALNEICYKGIYFNGLMYNNLRHVIRNGVEEPEDEYQVMISLPEREKDFLKWICTDKTLKEIAAIMNLSPRTIDGYRDNLFDKLKVHNRIGLVIAAIKNNLVEL